MSLRLEIQRMREGDNPACTDFSEDDGRKHDSLRVTRGLEADGVSTQYCKVWEGAGVPAAWLLHACDTNGQSVINRNPLSDIPHNDFVPLMGPLLVPEHYPSPESPWPPLPFHRPHIRRTSAHYLSGCTSRGRSVKTTLSNLKWIDGLARERRWRLHSSLTPMCSSSTDITRKHSPRVGQRPASIPARTNTPRTAPRSARRLLGRRSSLRPDTGVLPALRVVGVPHASRKRLLSLFVPLYQYDPVHDNGTPLTHRRNTERAQRERILAGHDGSQGSSAFSHTQLRDLAEQSASAPPQAGDHGSCDDSDVTEIAGSSNDSSRAQGPAGGQPAAIGARAKQQDAKMRADDVNA
ncbi:hypothetical protein EI94DRAFT_1703790 [Lactarius quietus]|nr:hypothetical protein EI94DRAFT_1703790 [Lactarius quietus]